jgi:hypothetical protein
MFELEQELDIPSHLRFPILSKLEEAAQSHLSKVADGKRTTDMLMKTSLRELYGNSKEATEEEMKLFARSYQRN